MELRSALIIGLLPLIAIACENGASSSSSSTSGTDAPNTPSADESSWRQPATLFSVLPMIPGSTVANIMAGDGYYAFELLKAGAAKVIAIDPDEGNVERIRAKAESLGFGKDKLEVRHAPLGTTGLQNGEADLALCVHSYPNLPDRINYLRKVRTALKSPAPLVLVDFNPADSPVGPPLDQRWSDQQVMDEMELVGATDIGAYSKKLPYQWIVIALDFVEIPDGPGDEVAPG
ncbi:MAG: class I SAM-dependent methyltransferase [Flavobacteriales bacterium]|nr:class I SAM-dependent methyltransferase [Flavobacteriales bacterium]